MGNIFLAIYQFCPCHLSMFFYSQKINQFKSIANEIASLHATVPLNLLCLNCIQVNEELEKRARSLENRLISYIVDLNRDQNRGYEKFYFRRTRQVTC